MLARPIHRRLRGNKQTLAGVALGTVAIVASTLAAPTTAQSAPDPACPPAYPIADLARDQLVHGLTVSAGTTPDPFTGKVLGVLNDGIAPGLDMILVRLTSPEIRRVGGIWAGMSGSPVYADDGSLIGAVSYGLAFGPSRVAGVTPAADMQALLDNAPSSATAQAALRKAEGADHVALPDRTADRIVDMGAATTAEADAGLDRLPIPFGISGMGSAKRMRQAADALDLDGVRLYRTGAVSADAPATQIVAGGNLGATVSYGDLTAGGVGTATAVCGDEVIAWGHPLFWSGPTTLNMHGADAIYIQEDPTLFPFKVANLTGPVGTITDDRLAGLRGVIGDPPESAEITSHVESTEGRSRDGTTHVSLQDAVPEIGVFALLANLDVVYDGIRGGSSRLRMTVEGERANGDLFEFSVVDRYASESDITFETIFDSWERLYRVAQNQFEDVTITDVSFRALLDQDYREYQISKLRLRKGGNWVTLEKRQRLSVNPGQLLRLRAVLSRVGETGRDRTVGLAVQVPRRTVGARGALEVRGGADVRSSLRAGSFPELLAKIQGAPRNDEVLDYLSLRKDGRGIRSVGSTAFGDVVGGSFGVRLRVVR